MTVKDIIQQVELTMGRMPEKYMYRLINDGLNEISSTKQHYKVSTLHDLKVKQRWYSLSDQVIDITKVEVKDVDEIFETSILNDGIVKRLSRDDN